MSTTYYALFHTLAKNCADGFIGSTKANRSQRAWVQAYRALNHKATAKSCKDNSIMKSFPKAIEDFANLFVTAQTKRHAADYDPEYTLTRSEVLNDIDAAEAAVDAFNKEPLKHKRAFAAFVTFQKR